MIGFPRELADKFTVESENDEAWTIRCRRCPNRYLLNKPTAAVAVKIGNLLTLLNHAASHPTPRARPEGTE